MKRAAACSALAWSLLALALVTTSCASHAQQVTTPAVRNGGSASTEVDHPAFNPHKRVRKLLHRDHGVAFIREEGQRFERWMSQFGVTDLRCDEPASTDFGTAVRIAVQCTGNVDFFGLRELVIEGRDFYHGAGAVVILAGCFTEKGDCSILGSLLARADGAVLAKLAEPGVQGMIPQPAYCQSTESEVSPTTGRSTEIAWCFPGEEEGLVVMVAFRLDREETRASILGAPQIPGVPREP